LPELVARGLFREDLMYRVAGHTFDLMALRDRQDFDAVLDTLLERFGADPNRADTSLRTCLKGLPWRGNVRQLAMAVQRALALTEPGAGLCEEDFDLSPRMASSAAIAPTGLLKRLTEEAIDEALGRAQGNVTAAARLLGIGRATLYRRLRQR